MGLCFSQLPYLITLSRQEEQTQDELSCYVRVNRAATARTLKTMEQAGLVTRRVNAENKRQKLVRLTDKASALIPALLDLLDEHNDAMLEGFSDEERVQLLALMDRLIDNVDRLLVQGDDTHDRD